MGHLVVPLKSVLPFYAQAANHPLPGDLVAADASTLGIGTHGIGGGASSYVLPDLRNLFLIGADKSLPVGDAGQYIIYNVNAVAGANSYVYYYLTGLPNYVVQSGDYLSYDVYLPSGTIPAANPQAAIEVEFANTPFNLRSQGVNDQNGIGYTGDYRAQATDQWYTRRFSLSGFVGNTLVRFALVNEYDGTYSGLTVRFQNLYITNSTGTKVNYVAWQSGDGTPPVAALYVANSAYVSSAASTLGAPGVEGKSGSHRRVLRTDHIAVHNHTGSSSSGDGSHGHTTSVSGHSGHTHNPSGGGLFFHSDGVGTKARAGATYYNVTCTMAASGGASPGNHAHTVGPGASGAHEHNLTISTASSGGTPASSTPFDSRPRYASLIHCLKAGKPASRALSIPMGAVVMWYADAQNETLPTGLSYCDGSSLTSGNHLVPNAVGSISYTLALPDLRNRYIIGGDLTKAFNTAGTTPDDPTVAPGSGYTSGVHSLSITVANLPDHGHTGSTSGNPWSAHNHSWNIYGDGGHTHPTPSNYWTSTNGALEAQATGGTLTDEVKAVSIVTTTSSNGSHNHTYTIGAGGSHAHTITVNSNGSGSTWDNRSPFIGIIFLMKTNVGLVSTPLKTIVGMRATTVNEAFLASGEWVACEGQTLTPGQFDMAANSGSNYIVPDFRKFFPLGADRTKTVGNTGALTDTAADAPGPKGTSGSVTTSMTTGTMPAHGHAASSDAQGSHSHGSSVATGTDGAHVHSSGCHTYWSKTDGVLRTNGSSTFDHTSLRHNGQSGSTGLGTVGGHGSDSGGAVGAHGHTVTVNNAGSGNAFQQRPRFHGVVFYMKIKR